MEDFLKSLKDLAESFYEDIGLTIVATIAVLILGLIVIKVVQRLVKRAAIKNKKLDNAAASFIISVVTVVLYIVLIIVVISALGFSTAGIIAGFSAVALAIALGLQDTLTSLTNGILIIFTKPFKQGDYIDVGGTAGTVKQIKLFNTMLVTPDNLTIIIPNSSILNSNLTNYSAMPLRRIDIVVPVSYSSDVDKVKEVLLDCVSKNEKVVNLPAPFCRLTEYADSSLNFTVRAWTSNGEYWGVKFDLMENILKTLRENDIEIPFNQLDVHFDKGGNEE